MRKYKDSWTFDLDQVNNIKQLYNEGDIIKALNLMERYIIKFPKDMSALGLYIILLISNRRYDDAEYYIKYVTSKSNFDLTLKKYMLCFYKKDYVGAYKLYPKIVKYISGDTNINYADYHIQGLFLRYKLGMKIKQKEIEELRYKDKQLLDYNESDALDHIIKKHSENCVHDYNLFEKDINIEDLFYKIKSLLPKATINSNSWLYDIYYFQYPDISNIISVEGAQFKYLKVIVARDTNNIIAIDPKYTMKKYNNVNRIDPEVKHGYKVKRLSNIEKFKQRYGNI